jgi:haloalkane dehalogenase
VTEIYRTPEERFAEVPDFPYEPRYREVDGLRLAHVDTGEGPPVVMLHGEPAWSYIWRKVILPVRDAGYRCIAPDHAGCGRSDKPTDPGWHSLEKHVALTGSLLEDLDLREATLVAHDWGGPIGLTLALTHPDRVSRIVVLDTAVDFRELWMIDAWVEFRDFVLSTSDVPVGDMMRATCVRRPADAVLAAYEAPFPVPESKASLSGMPGSIPGPDDPRAAALADRFYEALRADRRPMLLLWGEADLFLTLVSGRRMAARMGRQIDHVIPDAGHGLQEDQGELVGALIADWLTS